MSFLIHLIFGRLFSGVKASSFAVLALLVLAPSCPAASAPEWLRPFLSGEAAAWHPKEPVVVLLDHQEVHFSAVDRYTTIIHSALRASTEEGSRQLRTRLPYNSDFVKLTTVRAWIISPKGKVTSVSRDKFIDQPQYADSQYWNHFRVLTYDAASETEAGSILAWEYSFERPTPDGQCAWNTSSLHGLFRGEFEVVPPANARLDWHSINVDVPAPQPGSSPGALLWLLDKTKPMRGAPPEGFRPEPFVIQVKCSSKDAPLLASTAGWAALATLQSQFYRDKAVVTKEIQAIADAEVAGKKSRWERVRALTQYVQKKIAYLSVTEEKDVFAGDRPHTAAQVVERKLGDCKDKTTLLLALLRAAGEDGIPTLVAAGSPDAVDPSWPADDFNHVILALRSDEDVPPWWPTVKGPDGSPFVLFDPTARTLPLGCLPPSDQGGYVLLLAPEHGGLIQVTGNFSAAVPVRQTLVATLKPDGSAKISEIDDANGTDGALRQSAMDGRSKDQVTRLLEQIITQRGATAGKLTWSMDWDATTAHFTLHTDFEVPQAARKIGANQMLFTPPFQKYRMTLPPWETARRGVAYLSRMALEEEIRFILPDGATVEELPPPVHVEQGTASAEVGYAKEGSIVVCTQRFVRPAGAYSKSDYDKIRLLGEKIVNAQRRPVMLKISPAAAVAEPK